MRLSIKLFGSRYVVKAYFSPNAHVKWLPILFWAKVGPATALKEKNA
jgi:lipid-A-disaccharide synthase-like uncharacterized protein